MTAYAFVTHKRADNSRTLYRRNSSRSWLDTLSLWPVRVANLLAFNKTTSPMCRRKLGKCLSRSCTPRPVDRRALLHVQALLKKNNCQKSKQTRHILAEGSAVVVRGKVVIVALAAAVGERL